MRIVKAFLSIFMFLMTANCNAEITGTVVDAETGKPIEGAVVLVEWTITKGLPGMSYSELKKVVEVETSGNGKFIVSGEYNSLTGHTTVLIYKAGFVAWRNDFIFPGWKKRASFPYHAGSLFKLEKFKETYSHKEHKDFIEYGIMGLYKLPINELPKVRMGIEFEKSLIQQNHKNK
jgi:hypothetical protein